MRAITYATAQILRVLPRAGVSRAAGWLADHAWSPPLGKAVVGAYSRAYQVSLDECAEQDGWTSFDHFFTRALRDGARPVDRLLAARDEPAGVGAAELVVAAGRRRDWF